MSLTLTGALVGGVSAAGVLAVALQAQQASVFRGKTDLIQVDAVVVDAQGLTVSGLTRDDFELFDRGRKQDIAFVEEVSHDRPEARPGPLLRLDVADNYTARSNRLIIIVIDDLHFQGKTAEVQAIAQRVVSELGDRATLGLVTMSGLFGVEATEDRSVLLEAIDAFVDKFDPEGRRLDRRMLYIPPPDLISAGRPGVPPNLGKFFGDMAQYRVLQDVARMIGIEDQRRKAFVWISGGSTGPTAEGASPGSGAGNHYLAAQAGLIEALRKASVASYAVHTGDFGRSLLRVVADASGGFVADSSNLEPGLRQIVNELDHYYLLGFYPENESNKAKSEYRPLGVRVKRSGLVVRSRQGYQTGPWPYAKKNADPLVALSAGVLPKTDLPLRVSATQVFGGSKTSVAIALEASLDEAAVRAADGSRPDTLEFTVLAVDRLRKKVTRRITRETQVDLPQPAANGPGDVVRYQVLEKMDLPAGSYQLRVSAVSSAQKKSGSVYSFVDVVDPAKIGLALGGLALSTEARRPIASRSLSPVLPFAPVLDRVFDRSGELRVYGDVFRRDARRPVTATVSLFDDEQSVERVMATRSMAPGERGPLDVSFSLAGMPVGSYRLRAVVTDGENRAERQVGIVVR